MVLYHGTSRRSWKRKRKVELLLYLVNDLKDAWSYAYEEAARDEERGHKPLPVVYQIHLTDIGPEYRRCPDDGAYGVTAKSTWESTLVDFGSFAICGMIDTLKPAFTEAPCPDDVSAA